MSAVGGVNGVGSAVASPRKRRPTGEVAEAVAGCDHVADAPDDSGRRRRRSAADAAADAPAAPAEPDLDRRERRQSPERKAKGPRKRRRAPADVRLDDPESTTPGLVTGTSDAPTDPA
jgi:hypothetical protein